MRRRRLPAPFRRRGRVEKPPTTARGALPETGTEATLQSAHCDREARQLDHRLRPGRRLPGGPETRDPPGTRDYGDADTCRRTVFAWLAHYNTRRRHAADGHLSPNAYERRHHTAELTLTARSMTACPPSRGRPDGPSTGPWSGREVVSRTGAGR
ncbi:hypothetical protein E4K10_45120 [Streptomyces sp. T1317-0309]|nr:hypothetical protein E4K10_45120 [Streptomyces sp. T1317-0309]